MRATSKDLTVKISDKIAVDTTELQLLCGCGRSTAVDIGTQAKLGYKSENVFFGM